MDNPATESTALNIDGGAAAFADFLEPKKDSPEGEQPEAPQEEAAPAVEAEATPEAETEGETEAEQLVTIKIDGKEVQVPLSELKNGYQRQADYTRKTMEAAEQRKAAEAESQKAIQERQTYAENLQRLQLQLEGALQEQQNIDWDQLLNTDPQEYLRQQHLFQKRQAAWQQNQAAQVQLAQKVQAEQEAQRQTHLQQQQEALLAKLPEWQDSKKAQADKLAIRDYLLQEGYDELTVSNLADANMVVTARKAMLYDQMMAKAKAVSKQVATLPTKVEKPGTGANPGLDKRSSAFQQLSKTGRVEDAASLFSQFL